MGQHHRHALQSDRPAERAQCEALARQLVCDDDRRARPGRDQQIFLQCPRPGGHFRLRPPTHLLRRRHRHQSGIRLAGGIPRLSRLDRVQCQGQLDLTLRDIPLSYNSGTGVFSIGFGTTTNNTFSGTNTFNGNVTLAQATTTNFAITGLASSLIAVNANGSVIATTSIGTNLLSGVLGAGNGGTGVGSYATGDILYADSANHLAALHAGGNGTVLEITGGVPAWGAPAGGSGGGTFSTTTSQVAGELVNYSNSASDILAIGGSATTSAKYFFDPNAQFASLAGAVSIGGTLSAGTTTIYSLSVTNTGTSTFAGGLSVLNFNQTGNSTSTFAKGVNILTGCFSINGACLSAGSSLLGTANSWAQLQTLSNGFISNASSTFSSQTNFASASSTVFSVSGEGFFGTASTSNLTVGSAPSGFLRTNAFGAVSATSTFSLVNNVFGILGIGFGGTGTSTAPSYGQLLVGNASGGYTLTSTSSLGIAGGGGTWGSITGTLSNQTDLQNALNLKLSSSSLATSALLAGLVSDGTGSGSLVFATSPTFAGTPVFSGGLINDSVNSTTTIPNGTPYAWTVATSTSANPLIQVDTSGSTGSVSIGAASSSGSSVVLGATGEPANLVFAASSTIEGAGTGQLITIGANSDVVDFGVNVGLGTTTPGSIFSVQGVGNWTGATTTYYSTGGINLTGGCFSVAGTCIGGGGGTNYWTSSGGNIYNNTGTNVGIGTTTPGSLLSLYNIANFTAATSTFYGTGGINLKGGCFSINGACISGGVGTSYIFSYPLLNTANTISEAWGTTTANVWSQLQTFTSGFISNASSTFASTLNVNGGTVNYGAVSTSTIVNNVPFAWTIATSTTASPLFRIDSTAGSEEVTLGAPNSANVIIGDVNSSPNLVFQNSSTITTASGGTLTFGSGSDKIDFGVNVGIGTTTPTHKLSIWGAGTNGFFGVSSSTSGDIFQISTNGNVGVGTTTPYSRLDVWGPDTASTSAFAVVNSASTTEFTVYDTGNATLAGSLVQNSDARLKTDIQDLDGSSSLAEINALNPVTFNWIDPAKSSVPQFGFIAQQVEAVFPNLVSTTSPTALTPDGTLSLNYIDLISPIIAAIQELDRELTSLASTVAGFAQSITSAVGNFGQINTQQLCVQGTCVTGAQLQALLAAANQSTSASTPPSSSAAEASDTTPPVIQINGDNPAIIQVGATYTDLGATIAGPQADLNLGIKTFLNGVLASNILIDTSAAATDTIDYVVADAKGLTSTSTRTVLVQPAASSPPIPDPTASTTEDTSATSTP